MDDILINKSATVERCIQRIQEEYGDDFKKNYTKQDAIILNIERACQATIDMATHLIRVKKLDVPQTSREVFSVLEKHNIIDKALSENLQGMVGFRNISLHDYASLNLDIVEEIIKKHLEDFTGFTKIALKL